MSKKLTLTYDNPLQAAFLRILVWETQIAGKSPTVEELKSNQIQAARSEMGLKPFAYKSGGSGRFLKILRDKKWLSSARSTPWPVEKEWHDKEKNWRNLYVPPHDLIRRLSANPVVKPDDFDKNRFRITFRDAAAPRLYVEVRQGTYRPDQPESRRGIYFLNYVESLYVGQTDEFGVRYSDHVRTKGRPAWWVFMSIMDGAAGKNTHSDVIEASESLLISFWNEICTLKNTRRGSDQKPQPSDLQLAVLLAQSASACLLWLAQNGEDFRIKADIAKKDWQLPMKTWYGLKNYWATSKTKKG